MYAIFGEDPRKPPKLMHISAPSAPARVDLPQLDLAELFEVAPQAITQPIASVYGDGELSEQATRNDYLQVRLDGGREASRTVRHYGRVAFLADRINGGIADVD